MYGPTTSYSKETLSFSPEVPRYLLFAIHQTHRLCGSFDFLYAMPNLRFILDTSQLPVHHHGHLLGMLKLESHIQEELPRRKYKQLHCKIHLPQSCPFKNLHLEMLGEKNKKK